MTYDAFWLRYLRAHSRADTRLMHFVGTSLALACLLGAIVLLNWRLLITALLVGYGFAWVAHFGLERNKPETFGHPFWALGSDLRMLALFATGRLGPELRRAGIG